METTQMPTSRWMEEQVVVYPFNGIPLTDFLKRNGPLIFPTRWVNLKITVLSKRSQIPVLKREYTLCDSTEYETRGNAKQPWLVRLSSISQVSAFMCTRCSPRVHAYVCMPVCAQSPVPLEEGPPWGPHLKKIFYLFIYFVERGEGKEKERERHINVWLPFVCPLLETWPATQACALTGNPTGNPLVGRPTLNPLSHTSQGLANF